jgi:serine/threonine protein kinase
LRPPRTFCHGRFTFAEPLGKGGFAFVFAGWDNLMNENVAIKVENKDRKNASRSKFFLPLFLFFSLRKKLFVVVLGIKKEYRLLVKLCNHGCPVPKAIWCGRCEVFWSFSEDLYFPTVLFFEDRRVMVMQRMGESLSDFFKLCGKLFSLQTTLCVTMELITILESLHDAGNFFFFSGLQKCLLFVSQNKVKARYKRFRSFLTSILSNIKSWFPTAF